MTNKINKLYNYFSDVTKIVNSFDLSGEFPSYPG